MTQSVWDATSLPEFSKVDPASVPAELDALLEKNRADIDAIVTHNVHPTWDSLVVPLDEIDDRLGQFWSPISHLNSVKNSPEIREAYNACLPKLSDYSTELGQNKALYEAYKALAARKGAG